MTRAHDAQKSAHDTVVRHLETELSAVGANLCAARREIKLLKSQKAEQDATRQQLSWKNELLSEHIKAQDETIRCLVEQLQAQAKDILECNQQQQPHRDVVAYRTLRIRFQEKSAAHYMQKRLLLEAQERLEDKSQNIQTLTRMLERKTLELSELCKRKRSPTEVGLSIKKRIKRSSQT